MQIKSSIKIGILFVLIIALIIIGFVMFRRLNYDKQVYDTEVSSMIPSDASFVLQLNKNKKNEKLTVLFGKLGVLIDSIQKSTSLPIYVVGKEDNSAIISKITIQQEANLRYQLDKFLFPSYPPKVKKYNNTDILFYATTDNTFFCCSFSNGVFVGSYNYKLIEAIINTKTGTDFFSNDTIKNILPKVKATYSANLYLNKSDLRSIFNISLYPDSIVLEGFISQNLKRQTDSTKNYTINRSIFPNKPTAYLISTSFDKLSDTIKTYFTLPSYQFYTDTIDQPIHALKLKVDKFIVFNYLNSLETKYTGRKFSTLDFAFGDQRIYTASSKLSESTFKTNDIVYLTFFKNYLVYSTNKKLLVEYLIKSGKNEDNIVPNIINDENNHLELIYYNTYPSKIRIPFFSWDLIDSTIKSIQAKEYYENDGKKLNIVLNTSSE